MSMVQAPLPTRMPASVASYCASSLPCASAAFDGAASRKAMAQIPPSAGSAQLARRGDVMLCVVTEGTVLRSKRERSGNDVTCNPKARETRRIPQKAPSRTWVRGRKPVLRQDTGANQSIAHIEVNRKLLGPQSAQALRPRYWRGIRRLCDDLKSAGMTLLRSHLSRLRGRSARSAERDGWGKVSPLGQGILRKHPHPNPPPQSGRGGALAVPVPVKTLQIQPFERPRRPHNLDAPP